MLKYKYRHEDIHMVADLDADENWITHHVFPSSKWMGVTIARDHDAVRLVSITKSPHDNLTND